MALEVNTVPRLAGMRDEGGHHMGVPERRLNPSDEDRQFLDKGKSGRNQELLSSTIHQTGHGRNSSSGSFVGQPWAFDDGLPGDGSRDVSKVNALMDDGSPWEGRSGATLQRRGSVQGVLERLPHLRQLSVMPAIDHHPQHGNHLYRNYPTTPYESDIIDPSFYPRSNPLGPIPGVPQSHHSSNTFSPPFPQPAFTAAHLQPLHQHHMYGPSYTHTFRTAHDLLNQERRAHERTIIAYDALRAQLTAARDHLEAARHREEAAWEREDALRVDLGVMQMRWKEEQEEREEEEAFAFEMEGNLQELVREKQALREELDRVEKTTRSLTAEHSTLGTRLEECKAAHAREVNKVERELRQAQARYAELADSEERVRVRLGDVTKEREQAWTEVGDLRVAVEREQKVERETRKKLEQAQEMIKMLQVDLETARKTVEILQKTVKETPSSADPPQLEDVIRERDLAREQLDAQQRAHAAVLADWQKTIQYLCDEDDSSPLGARFVAQKEHLNALTAQLAQNIRSSTAVHAEMHALRARLEHEEARNASMADMANGWHREGGYAAEALNKLREEFDAAKKVAIEGGEALRREVAAKAVVHQELVKAQNMPKTLQKARSDGAQDVEVQSQAEAKTEVALTKVVVDALIKERDALMIERDSLHDELDAIRAVEKAVERYSDVSMSPAGEDVLGPRVGGNDKQQRGTCVCGGWIHSSCTAHVDEAARTGHAGLVARFRPTTISSHRPRRSVPHPCRYPLNLSAPRKASARTTPRCTSHHGCASFPSRGAAKRSFPAVSTQ
ncbi:hypothetical protein NliqN6_3430 [Naganishia liquefaciens]|uniref:Uncharacterized protein n=1 Tax=Naganishia liquefaciens TaxID=104408 RepID=A0A8H3TTW7_9TREE|nr:hypothetical protein NliqN6_3430 [Naganishia liquefaciens]